MNRSWPLCGSVDRRELPALKRRHEQRMVELHEVGITPVGSKVIERIDAQIEGLSAIVADMKARLSEFSAGPSSDAILDYYCSILGAWRRTGRHRVPVCLKAMCDHWPDRLYGASVVAIIKEVDRIREISVVGRPAQPETRLTELPIDADALRRHLGPGLSVGVEVSCNQCLGECFEALPESGGSAARPAVLIRA